MIRCYSIFRWAGYLCGAAGLVLMLAGRRMSSSAGAVQAAGAILLAAMFLCFVITQVMFIVHRLNRNKGAVRPRDA
ncbi:MAG: hypothetical protein AB7T27_06615 [Kiritimatiellia bacterium]